MPSLHEAVTAQGRVSSDETLHTCSKLPTLKVLAVIPGSAEGSSFIFARRQNSQTARAGIEIRTFNIQVRTSLIGVFWEWQRLRREIEQFRPDIVHSHYGTITGFLSGFASRTPLVITYRGSDLNGCPGIGLFRRYVGLFLSQLAALRATGIICVSSNLKRKLWWGSDKVSIIPSGVDMQLFCPIDKKQARRLLRWNDNERIVLFNAGREPELKGLALAEQALNVAERLVGPTRLVVLNGDVPPDDVPVRINAADCVLLSSLSEGSPNIVKEALSCSVPVVAVNVGDVEELLTGVSPSALTNDRNPEKLGEALADVLRAGSRSNGRQLVQRISLDRISDAICDVYIKINRYGKG